MSKTLLLADDSVTIQRVIELTFAHEDVRVISVSDGQRAIEWMEGATPDILLCDVGVPGVDGYALAEHVKSTARLNHVPVLLLAGAFEPLDRMRVQQTGCDGVLIKPFEPQQLVSTVKELLGRPVSLATAAQVVAGGRSHARRGADTDADNVTPFPGPAPARAADSAAHPAGFDRPGGHAEPLELPSRNVWELADATPAPGVAEPEAPALPPAAPAVASPAGAKVSLVNAFSALLAAEQAVPSAGALTPAPAAGISEATVEEAVRRVLVRMTDDLVRRLVLETAERLIREEIEKIKQSPDY